MVVFACNSCGSSLKKNQVDKHVFQCRMSTVSCMDCQKDFSLKEYGAHIKCISEVEKYSATGWKAPANFNKGEKKQQAWVDTVNDTLKKHAGVLTPRCRSLLQTIAKHDNVPRKKPKFMNFIQNITKNNFDIGTIEQVWTMIDEEWKTQAAALKGSSEDKGKEGKDKPSDKDAKDEEKDGENETNGSSEPAETKLSKREKKEARKLKQHKEEKKEKTKKTSECEGDADDLKGNGEKANGHSENGECDASEKTKSKKESKKDKKKRKRLESGSEITESKKLKAEDGDQESNENQENDANDAEEDASNSAEDFKWGAIIREVLEKEPNHEIPMKKLQKKVFSHYYAVVGDTKGAKTKEELISKLKKKLKKTQFKVFKDNVRLVV